MKRPVLVTSLLLSGLCLASCSTGQSAGPTSSPHCGADPYSAEKVDARVVTLPPAPPPAPVDYGADGILIVDHPLGEPPEIVRIRRGLTSHFVGSFINDGLESWQAVDLDKKISIFVQRRVFDKRAQLTRPFGDPVFPDFISKMTPPPIYVRKWSNDQRTEEEVINISTLRSDAEEALVCAANPIWVRPRIKPGTYSVLSDTLISNNTLLDFDDSSKKVFEKDAPSGDGLSWVFDRISEDHLKYEWPINQRK